MRDSRKRLQKGGFEKEERSWLDRLRVKAYKADVCAGRAFFAVTSK